MRLLLMLIVWYLQVKWGRDFDLLFDRFFIMIIEIKILHNWISFFLLRLRLNSTVKQSYSGHSEFLFFILQKTIKKCVRKLLILSKSGLVQKLRRTGPDLKFTNGIPLFVSFNNFGIKFRLSLTLIESQLAQHSKTTDATWNAIMKYRPAEFYPKWWFYLEVPGWCLGFHTVKVFQIAWFFNDNDLSL